MSNSTPNILKLATGCLLFALTFPFFQCANVDPLTEGTSSLSIQVPFEGLDPAGTELIVTDPSVATDFTLPSGTTLHIPAGALVHADGTPVSGPVILQFREFHQAAEIIASGIPMRVLGENNSEEWMQTAGMFELRGSQNGAAVALANDKPVEIGLLSEVDGPYDFWLYDEEVNNWSNQGSSSTPTPVTPSPEALAAEIEALQEATATPPVKPVTDGSNNIAISSDDLKLINCPELKGKDPIVLTYAGNDPKKAPEAKKWVFNNDLWVAMELQPTDEQDLYRLSLIGDSLYEIPVRLALTEADLEAATARYEANLKKHQELLALLNNKEAIRQQQQTFYRRVAEISKFGIFNYDILYKMPDSVPILADFDFGADNKGQKEMVTVYLITGNGRAVVGLPYLDWSKMRISPSADNKILAVLPNNQAAYFSESDFKAQMDQIQAANGKPYVFNMKMAEQTVNSLEDLQALIAKAES